MVSQCTTPRDLFSRRKLLVSIHDYLSLLLLSSPLIQRKPSEAAKKTSRSPTNPTNPPNSPGKKKRAAGNPINRNDHSTTKPPPPRFDIYDAREEKGHYCISVRSLLFPLFPSVSRAYVTGSSIQAILKWGEGDIHDLAQL